MKTIGIFIVTFIIFSLFSPVKVFAGDLLKNGGFETGSVDPWVSMSDGGSEAMIVGDGVQQEGNYALKISYDNIDLDGYQQTVLDIEGGKYYYATGLGVSTDTNIANHFMQIDWYESNDGSGSPLSTNNSNGGEKV
jgi:hypothetical protein